MLPRDHGRKGLTPGAYAALRTIWRVSGDGWVNRCLMPRVLTAQVVQLVRARYVLTSTVAGDDFVQLTKQGRLVGEQLVRLEEGWYRKACDAWRAKAPLSRDRRHGLDPARHAGPRRRKAA